MEVIDVEKLCRTGAFIYKRLGPDMRKSMTPQSDVASLLKDPIALSYAPVRIRITQPGIDWIRRVDKLPGADTHDTMPIDDLALRFRATYQP